MGKTIESGVENEGWNGGNTPALSFASVMTDSAAGAHFKDMQSRQSATDSIKLFASGLLKDISLVGAEKPRAGLDLDTDKPEKTKVNTTPFSPAGWPQDIVAHLDKLKSVADISPETRGSKFSPGDLMHQKKALDSHVAQLPDGPVKDSFRDSMSQFEKRFQGNSEEIARTYYQANRMFEEQLKPPLDRADGIRVAQALLEGAAKPEDTNQYKFYSCGVTPSREFLLTKNPSEAGRLAANALTGGEKFTYKDREGKERTVMLDLNSMKADRSSLLSSLDPAAAKEIGMRNQLGQVLDQVMINSALQKDDPDARYVTVQKQGYTLEVVAKQGEFSKKFDGLGLNQSAGVSRDFTKAPARMISNKDFDSELKNKDDAHLVKTESDLVKVLDTGLKHGPMMVDVEPGHAIFRESGESGLSFHRHVVSLTGARKIDGTDYCKISDQQGTYGDRWVSAADLVNATVKDRKDFTERAQHPVYFEHNGKLVPINTKDSASSESDLHKSRMNALKSGLDSAQERVFSSARKSFGG